MQSHFGRARFRRRLRELLREGDRSELASLLAVEHLLHNVGDITKVLDAAYTLCPVAEPANEPGWRGVLWAGLFAGNPVGTRSKRMTDPTAAGL